MEERGLQLKPFQEAVQEKTGHARGTSYGQVWSYVKGQAPLEPRREVVEAMAEELGVLPTYLLYGGSRTAEEAQVVEAVAEEEGSFLRRMQEVIPDLQRLDPSVQLALVTLLSRHATAHQRAGKVLPPEEVEERMLAYLQSVWAYMWQPLVAWGQYIGRDQQLDHGALNNYLMAALHAQNLLFHVVAPPGLTPDEVEGWPEYPQEEDTDGDA
jgi:hypothetical protein